MPPWAMGLMAVDIVILGVIGVIMATTGVVMLGAMGVRRSS